MNSSKLSIFLQKNEKLIPVLLFIIFVLITTPGIANVWNPDELVHRVSNALEGTWKFDETNFDYPSLPKYVMFGAGKLMEAFDFTAFDFPTVARFITVLLGGLIIVLVYQLTRKVGGNIYAALLAALFTLSSSEFSINARFAHNDLYLIFFLLLTVYAVVNYRLTTSQLWLYAAFLFVGMAISSKYNGISMIALPVLVFILDNYKVLREKILPTFETFFISAVLVALGYAIGTPKSLLWMAFYFKRALPVIFRHASYGRTPDSIVGLLGQWQVMWQSFSAPVFLLFMIAFGYWVWKLLSKKVTIEMPQQKSLAVILLAIMIFDLPIMISYNYQARFFLMFIPLFSVITGIAIVAWGAWLGQRISTLTKNILAVGVLLTIIFALMRVASVALLIKNDARIPAAAFIATLPADTSLEYTLYPPNIPADHFEREHNYPVFFLKFIGQEVPVVKANKAFNTGATGLTKRDTDYLVIDSFTYARFSDEYICTNNSVECNFFDDLLAGETEYQLIGDFSYELPTWLPKVSLDFVNPSIQVFERVR